MAELKSFDRVAHCYDETRGMPPDVTAEIADGIAAVLRDLAPQPHVIEIGVGTGRVAVPLAERGVRVTGLDISPRMVGVLRGKRTDIGVVLAESSRPPFRRGSFDAALFVHILHLVPDPAATMAATLRLTAPGGLLLRGQEDRPEGSLDEAMGDILQETGREVAGIELRGRFRHEAGLAAFDRAVDEAGCVVETRRVATWQRVTTAREVLEGLARRDFSGAWEIPEERMEALLAAMRPKVVGWFGGLDTPRPAERAFDLAIARLPGQAG